MASSPIQTATPPDNASEPNAVYFPGACFRLYAAVPPDIYKDLHVGTINILWNAKGRKEYSGGIREHVTHVWAASRTPEKMSPSVVAKFYDSLYFHDEYDSIDPLRLAARSVANEVKAYEMLQSLQGVSVPRCLGLCATAIPEQDGRTVYILLLEFVTGKDLQYLSEDGDGEDIVADHLCERHCEAIFAPLFRLMMEFRDLGRFGAKNHHHQTPGSSRTFLLQ